MDYSYQDMVKMQEDAARRVEDMRRRARSFVEDENEQTDSQSAHETGVIPSVPDRVRVISLPVEVEAISHREGMDAPIERNPPSKAADSEKGSIINSDSALILSLCMLLQAEKADEALIMSLLYLLV